MTPEHDDGPVYDRETASAAFARLRAGEDIGALSAAERMQIELVDPEAPARTAAELRRQDEITGGGRSAAARVDAAQGRAVRVVRDSAGRLTGAVLEDQKARHPPHKPDPAAVAKVKAAWLKAKEAAAAPDADLTAELTRLAAFTEYIAVARAGDGATWGHVGRLLHHAFDVLAVMNKKNTARNARLDDLERRLAAVEGRPGVKDAGVWRTGVAYDAGDIVSHQGSAWICGAAHVAAGADISHDSFGLFVKRGKDAR